MVMTITFLIVVISLPFIAKYLHIELDPVVLVALLVCLIPTTIGGLLPAIGIAGMNRALKANVLAKSGKAVEVAGDIDVLYSIKQEPLLMVTVKRPLFIL